MPYKRKKHIALLQFRSVARSLGIRYRFGATHVEIFDRRYQYISFSSEDTYVKVRVVVPNLRELWLNVDDFGELLVKMSETNLFDPRLLDDLTAGYLVYHSLHNSR